MTATNMCSNFGGFRCRCPPNEAPTETLTGAPTEAPTEPPISVVIHSAST